MCKICGRFICPGSCPNASDRSEVLCKCAKCKDRLHDGDYAYRIDEGVVWCENCMMDAGFFVK